MEKAEELEAQLMQTGKRVLGDEYPNKLSSMTNLASRYQKKGRWEDAEKLEVELLKASKAKLGDNHPYTLTSMNNLAPTWSSLGRSAEATALMWQCV